MRRVEIRLSDAAGLHARPADRLVRAARCFFSRVSIISDGRRADGKEIMQVLLLGATRGAAIAVEIEGDDEDEAASALMTLLSASAAREEKREKRVSGDAWIAPAIVSSDPGVSTIDTAIARTRAELRAMRAIVARERGTELAAIFGVQETLLGEGGLEAAVRSAVRKMLVESGSQKGAGGSSERGVAVVAAQTTTSFRAAVESACRSVAKALESAPSEWIQVKAADIGELGRMIVRFAEGGPLAMPDGAGPWIYVTRALDAATVIEARRHGVVGFLTAGLSPMAHAWILARGLGLPVAAVPVAELDAVSPGAHLTVTDESVAVYGEPADSRDRQIVVRANVASLEEAALAFALGAAGIGLVRTELLFASSRETPSASEQATRYGRLLAPWADNAVTFRLFDAGGDKALAFLEGRRTTRGIALLREHPAVLAAQLEALAGSGHRVAPRILLPHVESVADLEGMPSTHQIGAMIESLAGVKNARAIAERANFVCIGTNDLTASALGVDRDRVAPEDVCREPVRSAVHTVVEAAHEARREVTICGEAASVPRAIDLFLEFGVDALSVSVARLNHVRRHLEGA